MPSIKDIGRRELRRSLPTRNLISQRRRHGTLSKPQYLSIRSSEIPPKRLATYAATGLVRGLYPTAGRGTSAARHRGHPPSQPPWLPSPPSATAGPAPARRRRGKPPSQTPIEHNTSLVAAGTALTSRPPHRSGRAELPHPLLLWVLTRKTSASRTCSSPDCVFARLCVRNTPFCRRFPSASPLPSTLSTTVSTVLFESFIGTMEPSDLPCSFIGTLYPSGFVPRSAKAFCRRTRDLPVPEHDASLRARGL